jgi:hypothetical protein
MRGTRPAQRATLALIVKSEIGSSS